MATQGLFPMRVAKPKNNAEKLVSANIADYMRRRAYLLLRNADTPTLQPTALVHETYIKLAE